MSEEKKSTFLKGAVILGLAGVVVKILGAAFRIPITWIITSEGLGYYQTAYPIYVLLISIATSGFPVAISKMVSARRALGDNRGAYRVFKIIFMILLGMGVITSTVMLFSARYIVTVMLQNPKAYLALLMLVPAILLVPVMAAFRGYFQGLNNMNPSAISQIAEQFARVVFGVGLALIFVPKGLEYGAAGATFGATAGAVCGLSVMLYIYYKNKTTRNNELENSPVFPREKTADILAELITIALPIIIGALVMPTMNTIDLALVMRRLVSGGFTHAQANTMYAQLTGIAATLINLPQVITGAIAISLVPVISSAYAVNDLKRTRDNTNLAIRLSLLIGLPCAVGLFVLATPIIGLLYPNEPSSVGGILAIMSIGVVFLSLIQSFTSVLQGIGKAHIPVLNLFIGAGVKFIMTYVLTAIPSLNVKGAAISTVVAYIVAAVLDYFSVKKYLGLKFSARDFLMRPLVTAGIMGIITRLVYIVIVPVIGNSIATLMAVAVGGVVYVVTLFITKTITREDLQDLPKGKNIIGKLEKMKLLK
ncbi:putative polysaccharide biosynthesis protein [Proteocatella sphenisci]|uniref:putative polysaccharide biosynthesis protein n=1 Tax=Proteocatella sphenisci TaxID=181070 RepID=UPI00048B6472|nr:polysaccharide biosynthesis protein [Proteocatella sphenisci]